ncbi:hypothetical protein KHO65_gp033 [Mycobacterium phage Sauce]|uniref:Uncharacterized protein n=1 Tax=Mycobacterium phage Sauce TaxID=2419614 RepID=A0A3G3M4B4_9CAUD|nr:hypothetical protein KHO65_gp033 [Mycobacterium phage Sauce]AYR01302.1 hypothetical protein SEA_SAUCE_34 [Mycobacterium phage Sauce]
MTATAPYSVIWFEGTPDAPVKKTRNGFATLDDAKAWAQTRINGTTLPNVDLGPYRKEWTNQHGMTFTLVAGKVYETGIFDGPNRFAFIGLDKRAI